MIQQKNSTWSYLWPIAVSMGTLAGMNAIWNHSPWELGEIVRLPLIVYPVNCAVALLLIWLTLSDGRVTRRDLGLERSGWFAWKRLLGVAFIVLFAYGAYANLQFTLPPDVVDSADPDLAAAVSDGRTVVVKPSWGDFCFWFVLLLAASLTELLVFIAVGFCLLERCLKQQGMNRIAATTISVIFTCFAFGVYHYTHERSWWAMVFVPLMPVMLFNLICYILTRNFYLTLGLHGVFAALGMTIFQYTDPNNEMVDIDKLQKPDILLPTLAAFIVPFLVLHWLEASSAGNEQAKSES